MRIGFLIEGATERAFLPVLRDFLRPRLPAMPRIDPIPFNGPIPKEAKLKRIVERLLDGKNACEVVVALTDVYTGIQQFTDATDARDKLRAWVGDQPCFYAHAAQYEFEAWLLPYWPRVQQLARYRKALPAANPERLNHNNPPSHRLRELFRLGKHQGEYDKVLHAGRILKGQDLLIAAEACSELKALLNTLLTCSGGKPLP